MAKNLQSKLRTTDTVSVFDINTDIVKKFETELKAGASGASVLAVPSAFDAAKHAVSHHGMHTTPPHLTVRTRWRASVTSFFP